MAAVGTATHQPGVSVVSMSWGFPEGQALFAADEAAYDSVFNVPGVTFVASTGDYGVADPQYPAFSPNETTKMVTLYAKRCASESCGLNRTGPRDSLDGTRGTPRKARKRQRRCIFLHKLSPSAYYRNLPRGRGVRGEYDSRARDSPAWHGQPQRS
jgi:hypothetical protein